MSAPVVIGLVAALWFAASVQAITGFGFALLSMPLMSLVIDAKDAVAVSSLIGGLASIVLLCRTYRYVRWSMVTPLLAGAVAGMPLGLYVLIVIDVRLLKLLVAVAVLLFVAILARGWRLEGSGRLVDVGAGFISGVLNTSVSTNGPPLVLALQARQLDPVAFRATISALFVASSIVGDLLFAAAGRYTADVLRDCLIGVPALLVGGLIGTRIGRRMPADRFRPMVLGLLVLAAVSAGLSAWRG